MTLSQFVSGVLLFRLPAMNRTRRSPTSENAFFASHPVLDSISHCRDLEHQIQRLTRSVKGLGKRTQADLITLDVNFKNYPKGVEWTVRSGPT
jgi:hypothetical protein